MNSDGDGIISMTDIGSCFNPKNHPDVKSGKTTVPVLLKDFFETFNTVTNNGYVSLEQFLEYYTNASFFEDDSTFEVTMASVWMAPNKGSSSAASLGPRSGTSLHSIANQRIQQQKATANSDNELPALVELKTQLSARGARGIIGLARKFRIMDDSGNKMLDMSEFKKGIRECGLKLSEYDLNQLFAHFDRDRSGGVEFEEFLASLRVRAITINI
jgi:Ca2+-binding EF-hand superfamily protein